MFPEYDLLIPPTMEQCLEHLHSGIYILNNQRQIVYWNQAAEQITGFTSHEMLKTSERSCMDTLNHLNSDGEPLCYQHCPFEQTLCDAKIREDTLYLHRKHGGLVEVQVRIYPLFDDNTNIIGAVQSFIPAPPRISTSYKHSKLCELIAKSQTDSLTELKNRRFGEAFINRKLMQAQSTNYPFAIIFFDIDRFKHVNDHYGHDSGDLVLKTISRSVAAQLRPSDTFIRWGGDEFIIVLGNPFNIMSLESIAQRLVASVAGLELTELEPPLQLAISLGGTLSRTDDTVDTLIKRADENMYVSKRKGGNQATISYCI